MSEDVIVPSEDRELEQDFMDLLNEVPIEEPEVEVQTPEVIEPESEPEAPIIEEEVAPVVEDDGPDWEALFKAEEQRRKTTEGRFKKAREEWKQKEEEVASVVTEPQKPASHEDFWETYEEMLAPIKDLITVMVDERIAGLTPKLENIEAQVETTSTEAHYNTIAATHPDWREVAASAELEQWMNSLPYTSDKGMDGATAWKWFNEGTAQEVVALFTEYKNSRSRKSEIKPEVPKPDSLVDKVIAASAVESSGGAPTISEPKNTSLEEDFKSFL